MDWGEFKSQSIVVIQFIGKVLLVVLVLICIFYAFDPDKPKDPFARDENQERYR